MTDAPEARGSVPGDNIGETPADPITERLEVAYETLNAELGKIVGDAFLLPDAIDDDAAAERVTNFVLTAKRFRKRADDHRVEEKAEYLKAERTVDDFFRPITGEMDRQIVKLEGRLNAYNTAKAARQAAERREGERLQREAAQEAAQRAAEAAAAADQQEQEAQAAAARLRAAESPEERAQAEQEMRTASASAADQRQASEAAQTEAVGAERQAESLARAADKPLGRTTNQGATAALTKFWNWRVTDAKALERSLGPLGPHVPVPAIETALRAFRTIHVRQGDMDKHLQDVAGVDWFEDTITSVRSARR